MSGIVEDMRAMLQAAGSGPLDQRTCAAFSVYGTEPDTGPGVIALLSDDRLLQVRDQHEAMMLRHPCPTDRHRAVRAGLDAEVNRRAAACPA